MAELADALGSGPSPRNWGWRFESSRRHSLQSSFCDELFFYFLAAGKIGRKTGDDEKKSERTIFERQNARASSAPLFFRAGPDTMKTTILRKASFRRIVFDFCFF